MISKERKWSKIAVQMGYPPGKGIGTILKTHFERLLYPYDIFKEGKSVNIVNKRKRCKRKFIFICLAEGRIGPCRNCRKSR